MKKIYFVFIFVIMATSCPKRLVPPATEEGKNTFGFYKNGEDWVPGGGHFMSMVRGLLFSYDKGRFYLTANKSDPTESFHIEIDKGVDSVGKYYLLRNGSHYFNKSYAILCVYNSDTS